MLRVVTVVACLVALLLAPAAQAIGSQPERPVPRFEDLFKLPLLSPVKHWCCPIPWWLSPRQAIMQPAGVGNTLDLRK